VLIHQPAIDQGFGKATEIEIQAKEMLRMREWLEDTLAKHTGQTAEKVRKDIEVDTVPHGSGSQGIRNRRRGARFAQVGK
jgi:ATP-dependent protease ClpP protease subunit